VNFPRRDKLEKNVSFSETHEAIEQQQQQQQQQQQLIAPNETREEAKS